MMRGTDESAKYISLQNDTSFMAFGKILKLLDGSIALRLTFWHSTWPLRTRIIQKV